MTEHSERFFLVHGFNITDRILPKLESSEPTSMTRALDVFTYKKIRRDEDVIYINGFGSLIYFQDTTERCETKKDAYKIYMEDQEFENYYQNILDFVRKSLDATLGDTNTNGRSL